MGVAEPQALRSVTQNLDTEAFRPIRCKVMEEIQQCQDIGAFDAVLEHLVCLYIT